MAIVGQIMASLNNFFTKTSESGTFHISEGAVSVTGNYLKGQYVRMAGAVLCSGVFRVSEVGENEIVLQGLPEGAEESFSGYIYGLAPPPDFLALVEEIEAFQTSAGKDNNGVIIESFGGYSYHKATNTKGGTITWQDQFSGRLSGYRRMYDNPAAEIRENNR